MLRIKNVTVCYSITCVISNNTLTHLPLLVSVNNNVNSYIIKT